MSDVVWISTAPGHASNQRPLRHSFSEDGQVQFAIDCKKRNMAGEPLGPECFPNEIYGAPDAKESDYKLPDIFYAGSYWAVSKAAADVLRQFDLGGGALYPVKVFKKDRVTPVEGEFFCINFGNRKEAFLPEESRNVESRSAGKWIVRARHEDGDILLAPSAAAGADLWIDPKMRDALFLSDALGTALKEAKADKGFFLKKCRVI